MHDPKLVSPRGISRPSVAHYQMEATPGRHMQNWGPGGFQTHIINTSGICMIGGYFTAIERIAKFIAAVTGWERSLEEILKAGERIMNIRHCFNLREGINPLQRKVHPRIIGNPPQKEGPLAGVTADIKMQIYWNLGALDWDPITTKPSKKKLLERLNRLRRCYWRYVIDNCQQHR